MHLLHGTAIWDDASGKSPARERRMTLPADTTTRQTWRADARGSRTGGAWESCRASEMFRASREEHAGRWPRSHNCNKRLRGK